MNKTELIAAIREKRSFLCIGLDTDLHKIPAFLRAEKDPLFTFNKAVIDATYDLCVAYKPNLAFYESLGSAGWASLEKTLRHIRDHYPGMFVIADAKRGDIGNTSGLYARAFFEEMDFDAVTVAPYMGEDSVKPFLEHQGKWTILLALTSNRGAADFQFSEDKDGGKLYEKVLRRSLAWGNDQNMMYVVGATKAESLASIREIIPRHFLLVPGVGAQGGSLQEVCRYGMNDECGLLVNSSRNILYASGERDFAEAARNEALNLQVDMEEELLEADLL